MFQTVNTVAEVIRGYQQNQDYFAEVTADVGAPGAPARYQCYLCPYFGEKTDSYCIASPMNCELQLLIRYKHDDFSKECWTAIF